MGEYVLHMHRKETNNSGYLFGAGELLNRCEMGGTKTFHFMSFLHLIFKSCKYIKIF